MTHFRLIATSVFVALITWAAVAKADTLSTSMRIDGLPGDSIVRGHEGEIVLIGYSQAVGAKTCSRVVVTKSIDRASPGLVSRAVSKVVTPQVIISVTKAFLGDFFRVTLDQVSFESVELGEEQGQLVERVLMLPRSMRIEYRPQLADGSLGAVIASTVTC